MTPAREALSSAIALHQAGDVIAAERAYRRILAQDPAQTAALFLLAPLLHRHGRPYDAARLLRRALRCAPTFADAHGSLARLARAAHDASTAERHLRAAIVLAPDQVRFYTDFGLGLESAGRDGAACEALRRGALLAPEDTQALLNLGVLLRRGGRLAEAVGLYRRALSQQPGYAAALAYLGNAAGALGRFDEAAGLLLRAVAVAPDDEAMLRTLASHLVNADRTAEAEPVLRRLAAAHPDDLGLRLSLCQACLPRCYEDTDGITQARDRYRRELETLAAQVLAEPPAFDLAAAEVVRFLPYYLPYQGMNDRPLQAVYGALAHRLAIARRPDLASPPPVPPAPAGEPIRVGIASAFYCLHSNWKIPIRGWVEELDRARFALYGYSLGERADEATAMARPLFDRFVEGPRPFDAWVEEIRRDRLHVLIYPEIGMDPLTLQLAALPLVAHQCSSWGHPDTSGLPTIRYFLSSDLMEPDDGQDHYTERLIRLPGLSIFYRENYNQAHGELPFDEEAYGLRPGSVRYLCLQSLPKYLPQHDHILARIARNVPGAQFVFLDSQPPAASGRVRARLRRAFAEAGADPDAVLLLPFLTTNLYAALQRRGHVFLDSIGWSGCNSTLEALNHALPIVTLPGRFMRERHSLAILRMMGIADTIARDVDEYVAIATRLGTDPEWRRAQSERIRAERHRVYADRTSIAGLEDFLERCARGGPA